MTIPFTYYLYHISTGKKYYGVRYRKGCQPSDLWTKYFSSSKEVKKLVKEFGTKSFEYHVRKIFKDKQEAVIWESKVLRRLRVVSKPEWINRAIFTGDNLTIKPSMLGRKHSAETKKKMSTVQLGSNNPMFGKHHTAKAKAKISANHRGMQSSETRQKISEMKKGKTHLGIPLSEDHKVKLIEANTGAKRSDASRERMRQAQLGSKASEEKKQKMSEAQKKRWALRKALLV